MGHLLTKKKISGGLIIKGKKQRGSHLIGSGCGLNFGMITKWRRLLVRRVDGKQHGGRYLSILSSPTYIQVYCRKKINKLYSKCLIMAELM